MTLIFIGFYCFKYIIFDSFSQLLCCPSPPHHFYRSRIVPAFVFRSVRSDKFGHVLFVKIPGEEKKFLILVKPTLQWH